MPRARILLIGAPAEDARALREGLATPAFDVEIVTAPPGLPGDSALASVLWEPFDLILVWEGDEGVDVRGLLARQTTFAGQTPVVAMVGEGMERLGLACVMAGADSFVVRSRWQSVAALVMRYERERFRRQLPELARMICHDLNSFQATIPLATHLLRDRLDPLDGELLAAIENATARSAELVGSLYALALDASDDGTQGTARASIGHVLAGAARRLRSVSQRLAVELDVSADPLLEVGEPDEVARVIVGLGLVATAGAPPGTVLRLVGRSSGAPDEIEVILVAEGPDGRPPTRGRPAIPPAFGRLVERLRGRLEPLVSPEDGEGYRLRLPTG